MAQPAHAHGVSHSLVLSATVAGQEMVVFPANLWAGGLTVEGMFDEQEVTGDCFTEIVGLDEPFGRSLFGSGRPAKWEKVAPRKPRARAAPAPRSVAP